MKPDEMLDKNFDQIIEMQSDGIPLKEILKSFVNDVWYEGHFEGRKDQREKDIKRFLRIIDDWAGGEGKFPTDRYVGTTTWRAAIENIRKRTRAILEQGEEK